MIYIENFKAKINFKVFLIFLAFILAGCANTSTVKSSSNQFDGKDVIFVPTGSLKVEGVFTGIGPAFGLLGILIEQAATESSRAKAAEQVKESFGIDSTFDSAGKILQSSTQRFGAIKKYSITKRTLLDQEFSLWFNSDSRSDYALVANNSDIIIDFGFQDLTITSWLSRSYAGGTFGLRVIDSKTGKVLARARTYATGASTGEMIAVAKDHPTYNQELNSAFTNLVNKITKEAIAKVTEK